MIWLETQGGGAYCSARARRVGRMGRIGRMEWQGREHEKEKRKEYCGKGNAYLVSPQSYRILFVHGTVDSRVAI